MTKHIFLAGASGVLGRTLAPLLISAGYRVSGTTRYPERAAGLKKNGVNPVVVDVYDRAALIDVLERDAPDAVIHQLTDLPRNLEPALMAQAVVRNARLRSEGTRNLTEATLASGCSRMIVQSIAWAYAVGRTPHQEQDSLDVYAEGTRRITINGIMALEQCVLGNPALKSAVLRYGQLYGPGTAHSGIPSSNTVHVEAAAHATLLALQSEVSGVFNITDDQGDAANFKARQLLQWNPQFRLQRTVV